VELPDRPRVVVGVDDSPASRWALAWAIGDARLRHMALVAVHVSRAPVHPFSETLPLHHAARLGEEERSLELVEQAFEDVAGGVPTDLETSLITRLGEPGHHLVELAREGDLLVLGRSRRSLLARMVLPSTSIYCARYAKATVVLVQAPSPPEEEHVSAERSRRFWR
jgi:nucleotide-binding universal stress UspA family protein